MMRNSRGRPGVTPTTGGNGGAGPGGTRGGDTWGRAVVGRDGSPGRRRRGDGGAVAVEHVDVGPGGEHSAAVRSRADGETVGAPGGGAGAGAGAAGGAGAVGAGDAARAGRSGVPGGGTV